MAIMVQMEWDGVTGEQYDQLRRLVNFEVDRAPGGIFHVASATESGLRIVDVWESPEALQTFVDTRMMPAAQQLGLAGQPRVEVYPVTRIFAPAYQPA